MAIWLAYHEKHYEIPPPQVEITVTLFTQHNKINLHSFTFTCHMFYI